MSDVIDLRGKPFTREIFESTARRIQQKANSVNINETVGYAFCGAPNNFCDVCGSLLPNAALNYEARVHHNARRLECIDRQACERRKRKRDRKASRR